MEKTAGGFPPSRVNAEAQLALEVRADNVDSPFWIVAVYEQVGADGVVVGEAEAVLGRVDNGNGLEADKLGELDGEIGGGGGSCKESIGTWPAKRGRTDPTYLPKRRASRPVLRVHGSECHPDTLVERRQEGPRDQFASVG